MNRTHDAPRWLLAGVLALAAPIAGAQDPSRSQSGYSLVPYTQRGYVGINLGKSSFDTDCGPAGLSCDDPDLAGKIYFGGALNDRVGIEFAYVNMGRADRAGGHAEAQGANASLVGTWPVNRWSLFAKLGGTYGFTKVTSEPGSGVTEGRRRGLGVSYGAGIGYDLQPNSTVVLEWERHDFRFRGTGREGIDALTLGYVYRY